MYLVLQCIHKEKLIVSFVKLHLLLIFFFQEGFFDSMTMTSSDGFPASFYGEPGVLGMLSNGISAFLVLLQNFNTAHTGITPQGVENILAGNSGR